MLDDIKNLARNYAPPLPFAVASTMLILALPINTATNWPIVGEFVMDSALKGVLIAIAWFLFFSVYISWKLLFPQYRDEVHQQVMAIRNMVREIRARSHSAGRDEWQRWDNDFFNVHLTKTERKSEWKQLQPVVSAVRTLRLADNFDNQISTDAEAQLRAYEDLEKYIPKYLRKTSWAERK